MRKEMDFGLHGVGNNASARTAVYAESLIHLNAVREPE